MIALDENNNCSMKFGQLILSGFAIQRTLTKIGEKKKTIEEHNLCASPKKGEIP